MSDENSDEDLHYWMDPPLIDAFFQEFRQMIHTFHREFPQWSFSIDSTGKHRSDGKCVSTAICCVHPNVPYLECDPGQASLEIRVSVGGVGSDRVYFEMANVRWFEQNLVAKLHGVADLLGGEKPAATDVRVESLLSELPILYDDARRIMTML